MAAATSSGQQGGAAAPDDLDNLLDYDEAVDDFWKDLPQNNGDNANNAAEPQRDMDEEVKMAKKRKPNPKLDQDRYARRNRSAPSPQTDILQTSFKRWHTKASQNCKRQAEVQGQGP